MAKNDIPTWTLVGAFIGMMTSALVDSNLTIFGAILGGLIGYLLGKDVK